MTQTRRNAPLLFAAAISLSLAAVHTWWGFTSLLKETGGLSEVTRASFEISWHAFGATLLAGGVALLYEALRSRPSTLVPVVVGAIYATNFLVFLLFVALKYPGMAARTVVQMTAAVTIVALIIVDVRRSAVNGQRGTGTR